MKYNLTDINDIKRILSRHGFQFTKSLGQNFLTTESIPKMIARSGKETIKTEKSYVIEVGPGIGCLTYELSKIFDKVVSVEIDKSLMDVLKDTLSETENVSIVNKDVLKVDLQKLIDEQFDNDGEIAICANLPYYITTPVIMYFLESNIGFKSMTVMVQKEVAKRLCADNKSKDYGTISVTIDYLAQAEYLFDVPKEHFIPQPKVDSAVVRLTFRDKPKVEVKNEEFFKALVKAGFAQRRKTFLNSVSSQKNLGIEKEEIGKALESISLSQTIRGEAVSIEDYAKLSDILCK